MEKKKTNKQREKETNKETHNKQTSIDIKLELSQRRPAASPSFPIFVKNNIHSKRCFALTDIRTNQQRTKR